MLIFVSFTLVIFPGGDIKALVDIWIVGDEFVHLTYPTMQQMWVETLQQNEPQPFIYLNFNPSGWYFQPLSDLKPTIIWFHNSLVQALNQVKNKIQYPYLPDKDILNGMISMLNDGAKVILRNSMKWLILQTLCLLDC